MSCPHAECPPVPSVQIVKGVYSRDGCARSLVRVKRCLADLPDVGAALHSSRVRSTSRTLQNEPEPASACRALTPAANCATLPRFTPHAAGPDIRPISLEA